MDLDLAKRLYDFEWQQRSTLTTAVGIPILGVTAIGGAATSIAQSLHYSDSPTFWRPATVLLIAAAFLGTALTFIVGSLIFPAYQKLAAAGAMLKMYENLKAYYTDAGEADPEAAATKAFNEGLRQRTIEATDVNGVINQARANRIRVATIATIGALVFTAIASGFYIVEKVRGGPAPTDVRIISIPNH